MVIWDSLKMKIFRLLPIDMGAFGPGSLEPIGTTPLRYGADHELSIRYGAGRAGK
jgi:hypothetical protein